MRGICLNKLLKRSEDKRKRLQSICPVFEFKVFHRCQIQESITNLTLQSIQTKPITLLSNCRNSTTFT